MTLCEVPISPSWQEGARALCAGSAAGTSTLKPCGRPLPKKGIPSGDKEGKTSAMVLQNEGAEAEHIPPNSCQRTIRMKKRPTCLKDDTVLHCSEVQVHGKVLLAALCSEDEHSIPCDWPVHAH